MIINPFKNIIVNCNLFSKMYHNNLEIKTNNIKKPTIFWLFLWCEKINYFPGWGVPPPPFAENSAKIINLIFEPFPNIEQD